jgi:hypothetical protein
MRKRPGIVVSNLPAATARGRAITESYSLADCPAPLRVDQEAGIIFGVKVVGRTSRNNHGRPGVTEGTEYTLDAFRNAVHLYEGVSVYTNHPSVQDRARGNNRDVRESIGVIRNPRLDGDSIRGDLHYKKSHSFTPEIVEDVQRSLGTMALSHNAMPGRERVANGKLIIESIESVNSVDLVDKGGTNTNLWESHTVAKTFKTVLESFVSHKSKAHKAVARRVLEMDDTPTDAPMDAGGESSPEDQLLSGFEAAITAIFRGDGDAKSKIKKIAAYIKAHDSLTSDEEPVVDDGDADDDGVPDSVDDKVSESLKREIKTLKAREACRELCESEDVKPSAVLLKSLMLLESTDERKQLLTESKASRPVVRKPTSGSPHGRTVTESKKPKSTDEFLNSIRD